MIYPNVDKRFVSVLVNMNIHNYKAIAAGHRSEESELMRRPVEPYLAVSRQKDDVQDRQSELRRNSHRILLSHQYL